MKAQVFFYFNGSSIFSLETDCVPREGELVKYKLGQKFLPHASAEHLREMVDIEQRTFIVDQVVHSFRRIDVKDTDHTVEITLVSPEFRKENQ